MSTTPRGSLRNSRYVLAAFALVAALLAVTNGLAVYEVRHSQQRVRATMENATASIRLVGRMEHDINQQRLLVEAHIFEKEAVAMARVEARLAEVQADYDAAARQYAPLAIFPGEVDAWREFKRDVAAIQTPVAEALALSRRDQDAEARVALMALEGRFAVIASHAGTLVRINQGAADESVRHVAQLQRTATALFVMLTLLGVALTVVIGAWIMRVVRQRDDESARYASLLEERNSELDAFAGRVAHDLRGPLSVIGMSASVLARTGADVPGTVAILRTGVQRMEKLIQDLLDLSRVEATARSGAADPALVASLLHEELAPRLEAERATLRVAVEPAVVQCTEGLLRQVLANLVDNALKYRAADAAPEVELSGRADAGRYELRVADNGMGMSNDEARHAFEPFYRAHRAREAPGTGLGLSIVKRVIEASAGTVAVESKLGHGTTFVIRLALAGEAAGAATH